jgi:transcriptional regulator with XRE-family HTH domain
MSTLDPQSRRRQLGRALRDLRVAAHLSQPQLADRLGVAQSTVSRMETGRQFPSPDLLDRWAAAIGATTQQRVTLDELAEAVATEAVVWRHRPHRLATLQRETADLEESASLIRGYHPVLIHSLLQIPSYAQAAYQGRAQLEGRTPTEVTEAVRARMAKQALLSREGHRFEFLLTEAGLRWWFVPREIMAAQLDRLAQVARMPNVLLGVLPLEIEEPVWAWQGFSAFLERVDGADDLVLVETLTAGLTVRNAVDIARYDQAFKALLNLAAVGADALAILDRLATDLR